MIRPFSRISNLSSKLNKPLFKPLSRSLITPSFRCQYFDTISRKFHSNRLNLAKPYLFTNSLTEYSEKPLIVNIDRAYRGPLQSAILDNSGTTCDKWILAVVKAMVYVFKHYKIDISNIEARSPMGVFKLLHIQQIFLRNPHIVQKWKTLYGKEPNLNENDPNSDLSKMFKIYTEHQIYLLSLPQYNELLTDVANVIGLLRNKYKLSLGSTTGFGGTMQDMIFEHTKKHGYMPDYAVPADAIKNHQSSLNGKIIRCRPFLDSMLLNMLALDVTHPSAVLKVDDTTSGVMEGLNAGCWAVGIAKYNNKIGEMLENPEELLVMEQQNPKLYQEYMQKSRAYLATAKPHYVINTIKDLPLVVEDINFRLSKGESPSNFKVV